MTVAQDDAAKAATAWRKYAEELPKIQASALRSAAWKITLEVQDVSTSRGIGRAIWGGGRAKVQASGEHEEGLEVRQRPEQARLRRASPPPLVDQGRGVDSRPRYPGDGPRRRAPEAAIEASGRGRVLKFTGPGGVVFASRVEHPGASFRRWELIGERARRLWTYFPPKFAEKDLRVRKKLGLV